MTSYASGDSAGAGARELWRVLVDSGEVARLYVGGDPARGIAPRQLHRLFTDLEAITSVGSLLGICVQTTTAIPMLSAAAVKARSAQDPAVATLTNVLSGDQMVALAATDTTPGSDLAALTTTVTLGDATVRISGQKQWVTNAAHAEHILVLARHAEGDAFTNFTWVLVPSDAAGVTIEPVASMLFEGAGCAHVSMRDVVLPSTSVTGGVGRGLIDFSRHISVERLASAVWGHSMSKRVLRETWEHLRHRGEGPGNLWSKDEIRRRVAKLLLSIRLLESLIDAHQDQIVAYRDSLGASMLKAAAAQTVEEVMREAAHLQGARAFADGGAQVLRAQAGLWGIGGGTYEVMLSTIADHVERELVDP